MFTFKLPAKEIKINKLVIKLGTKQITDTKSINYENIKNLVEEIYALKKSIKDIVLVVSGAIGLGRYEIFNGKEKQLSISEKQALAGVGQIILMEVLRKEFKSKGMNIGQVLLTQDIFDNRKTYLNAKNTMAAMFELGVIPVINENDSVATEEIKVGQNDTLGALVSLLIDADMYIMLTDTDGLYKNFNSPDRELIRIVERIDDYMVYAKDPENNFAKGGMITKLNAAKIACASGIPVIIANGFKKNRLNLILKDFSIGTLFLPSSKILNHKKKWILGKKPKGKLIVDDGAKEALRKNKSLLASGIKAIEGNFDYGDTVIILDNNQNEIARGLVNYDSKQVELIRGKKSEEIEKILGVENTHSSVVHIDNLILL